jgi:cell division protein ZapA (FtsZ GTPase activity inhibitor)
VAKILKMDKNVQNPRLGVNARKKSTMSTSKQNLIQQMKDLQDALSAEIATEIDKTDEISELKQKIKDMERKHALKSKSDQKKVAFLRSQVQTLKKTKNKNLEKIERQARTIESKNKTIDYLRQHAHVRNLADNLDHALSQIRCATPPTGAPSAHASQFAGGFSGMTQSSIFSNLASQTFNDFPASLHGDSP